MSERLPRAIYIHVDGDTQDIEFVPSKIATKMEWKQHLDYPLTQHRAIGAVIAATPGIAGTRRGLFG